jgi:D-mannonate dehydratase
MPDEISDELARGMANPARAALEALAQPRMGGVCYLWNMGGDWLKLDSRWDAQEKQSIWTV